MLDPNLFRFNIKYVSQMLKKRNFILDIDLISKLEQKRKNLQIKIEQLQIKKKNKSKDLIKKNTANFDYCKNQINKINNELFLLKKKITNIKNDIKNIYEIIPNIPLDDVPYGKNNQDNKEIKKWGDIPSYNFPIKNHLELGSLNNGIDLESGVILSGSKFVVMRGLIAYLHRILIQFMLDLHVFYHNYEEIYVPYIVKNKTLYGTGQLPKFSDDIFHIKSINHHDKNQYSLIPTAEVPLTNIVYNKIIKENTLPIKLVAHSPCFRSEVGSYGQYNKGLIRTHQFDKVELVQLVRPEDSLKTLEIITQHAEKVLKLLKLPYRKMLLCTGDMGFASSKTYDLEVWFPSKEKYYEVSSCSNMSDFQSRRIKARYRKMNENKNIFIHTLNGSGLAVGRTLAAIMENYQLENGNIKIPNILKPYMKKFSYKSK
ncbi:serine--tRNA ligase [Enterobacteriaceae endosymbiont of Plateumaris braccata]|uniref:serine--tRNA ligase n=1 Tax=Enterobacteriaceae endosymbiont of Plateumaris braccata TaxID=2675793 RepID=UPI00144976A0|nr:serine--tRNA ligase [Enterobacteriaceae endosymbiont of Plateumaris braccata]QJC28401.1 serine--tRNA ligase [Enterobacteriaceae endosymbiont of Plateumaris braccata]